jgi:hypothetical protein
MMEEVKKDEELIVDDTVLVKMKKLIVEESGQSGHLTESIERIFIPDQGNKSLADEITHFAEENLRRSRRYHCDSKPFICSTLLRRKR